MIKSCKDNDGRNLSLLFAFASYVENKQNKRAAFYSESYFTSLSECCYAFKGSKGRGDGETADAGFLRTKNINREDVRQGEGGKRGAAEVTSLPMSYRGARLSLGVKR